MDIKLELASLGFSFRNRSIEYVKFIEAFSNTKFRNKIQEIIVFINDENLGKIFQNSNWGLLYDLLNKKIN